MRLPVSFVASIALALTGCGGSGGGSLDGLGDQFDIPALSEAVFRLCESTECGDYSRYECELFLRYDVLEYARFSEDPEGCLAAFEAEFTCLADAGSCDEESCYHPDDACELVEGAPDVEVPPAVQPTQVTCDYIADCNAEQFGYDRELSVAACQIEYVSRAEILQHDRGPACAQAFIDFITCIGQADLPCFADGDDEEASCPAASAAFSSECYG